METNGEEDMVSLEYAIKRSLLSRNKLAVIMQGPNDMVHFCCVECSYKCEDKEELEKHLLVHNKEYRYLCGICGTGLKRREHLERHTLEHQEVRPHVCSDCGKAFKRKEHMNIHKSIHKGDRNEFCPVCHKAFYRKDHLRKHLQTHTKTYIEHSTPLFDQVMVEIKQEAMEEDIKPIIGNLATEEKRSGEISEHEEEMGGIKEEIEEHGGDMDGYEGEMGGYEGEMDGYKEEMSGYEGEIGGYDGELGGYEGDVGGYKEEMGGNEEEYEGGWSMTSSQLEDSGDNAEMETSATESDSLLEMLPSQVRFHNERPYSCYICHKSYKRRDHLKIHSWTHMKKDKVCSECGKAFPRQEQLLTHMNTHLQSYRGGNAARLRAEHDREAAIASKKKPKLNGESRPHECTVCQRRFKRKQHLKQHLNVHFKPHQPSVWCSICGEGFDSNATFEGHQCSGSVDGSGTAPYYLGQPQSVKQEAKKENKYPQEFVNISQLSPAGEAAPIPESSLPIPQRVFVCKFCTKPFKRKDHYKIHLHIHTGVKSFFCPTCGKGFYRKDHMQKHIQIHDRKKDTVEKTKRQVPDLFPINMLKMDSKPEIKPEITIHAPSNSKLRLPLQIKVPYQMVTSLDNGEQRAITVHPQTSPK